MKFAKLAILSLVLVGVMAAFSKTASARTIVGGGTPPPPTSTNNS